MKESARAGTVKRSNRVLLVDVSNTFTKLAVFSGGRIGRVTKVPTRELGKAALPSAYDRAVISCVVPEAKLILSRRLRGRVTWLDHRTKTGVLISYPEPSTIGADRLANAAAAIRFGKLPAIVVDFGTAVTFDVVDAKGCYLGGIIAPGLATAARALHERTALLPHIGISKITSPVGKSTSEAIRIGLLLGAVGLIRESVTRINHEVFGKKRATVIATGGDAPLVDRLSREAGGKPLIDLLDPLLTLRGLSVVASKTD